MKAEFVIVGAGVAGALVASRLAEAGRDVILVEAGTRVDRTQAVERYRSDPYPGVHSPYEDLEWAPRPRLDDLNHHFLQQGPDLFYGLYERRVGGSTWHWLGTTLRMNEEDLALKTHHGIGRDWPLTLGELLPYYEQAEVELGVAGQVMPPIPFTPVDHAVARAAGERRLEPLPQARNSTPYQGRPACCGAASCIPICPIGAKYDAGVHVDRAVQAGARLLERTVARRVEPGRVDCGTITLLGGTIVLAANAVETARLLLLSGWGDPVGRNLMGASAQLSWGLAPEPVRPYRGPQATAGFFDRRQGPHRRHHAGYVTTVATDGWPHAAPRPLASQLARQGLRGAALRQSVEDHLARQVALVSTCEELPHPDNRVTVDTRFRDALGLPRPRIAYAVGDYTRKGLARAERDHDTLLKSLKADEVGHAPAADSAYLLGTCRMGLDSGSVVDPELRSHRDPNLFIVGGAVFPTAGTATPTLTIAALALRLADRLL